MDPISCIPIDKHDHDSVARATALGFPGLNPVLSDLLGCIQDANWPIAPGIAEILVQAGPEIVAPIHSVLTGPDGMWKYWTIEMVITRLPDPIVQDLRPDLERLVASPTADDMECEANLAARDALAARARH